ncbi:adenine specific DNA methyltransferase [Helicobacter sp. 13S00477-4]|uniref:adenine specific DNA methyltransferase n=1 Tax=Helicobacter sp. 13S00477-4 TaxID=1905759 RepID=UPI002151FCD5|nr:adenine specific DNA methyltransferase [Helicobacter sp. 13S00477-4]
MVCDRGCKLQKVDNMFITQDIVDYHLIGSGSYAFPLYLYPTGSAKKTLKKEK